MENAASAGPKPDAVSARTTGHGMFEQAIVAAGHDLVADEPAALGGLGTGPSPYDLLSAGLAACTSITIRLYADRRKMLLPEFIVEVSHDRVHADDCSACLLGKDGRIDRFTVGITILSPVTDDVRVKVTEIAEKCPAHRTLASSSAIVTQIGVA